MLCGFFSFGQGVEDFTNIPTGTPLSYLSRTWTGTDAVVWNSTLSRTDQTLTGKAICTNGSGTITSPSYAGGMGVLSFNYVRAFTGITARSIQVWVNGAQIGSTITVSPTSDAVVNYSQAINVGGAVVLELRTSGAQIKIDDINWVAYSPCTPPTTQATLPVSSSILNTTATIGATRGDGNSVLVVARANTAVNADPSNGTTYTANTIFGSGSQIGTGNFVVYDGNASPVSVNLTGLTGGTTYHFAVYEFILATHCYNLVELTGSFTTASPTPDITLANNGTQVVTANVPQNTINHVLHKFQLSVINANATLTGINCTTNGTYIAADVTNLKVRYSADNVLDVADVTLSTFTNPGAAGAKTFPTFTSQIINLATTGYIFITADVAAAATIGNTISLSAITTANLTFTTGTKSGATTAGGTQTITASAPLVPQNFSQVCTTNTTQSLSWSPPLSGSFDGYLLVVRQGAVPNAVTTIIASTQAFNLNYTSAPTYNATTSRVLYVGSATSVTVTGLTQGLPYTFALLAYKNNGASPSIYSSATTTTQTIALPNVTSASASPGNSSASLTWSNPIAACYDQILVVPTSAAGISFIPTGCTTPVAYTASSIFTAFNQPVYYSSGNLVNVTGLTNGTTYYFEIFVRNGCEWSTGIEVSVTPINIVPTVLKTGDLMLIAYDNAFSASADDAIRLITFVDINPGTKFLWSNATYETGGLPAANLRTDKWFNCVSTPSPTGNVPFLEITYDPAVITSIIPAGSVFCIRSVVTGTASTITAISPTGISYLNSEFDILGKNADGTVLLSHGSVNVSTSNPDAMFLLQGNFIYNATGSTFDGTVLSAIQDGATWFDLSTDLTTATGDALRTSRKHPQLLCASIQGNLTPASYEVSYNVGTTFYTNDNKPNLIGKILNYVTNWSTTFGNCPTPNSPFVITASDPFNRWTGAISTNWFDCNNWTLLTVPDELTDVAIYSTATRDASIDANALLSDGFLDVAKCKNLTLSGRTVFLQSTAAVANKLEIYGNLLIDTTGNLDMGDGNSNSTEEISIFGNWNNSLGITAFDEGLGTVKFVGSTAQVINNNIHASTEEFYNVVLDNDFNTFSSNNLIAKRDLEIKTNKIVTISNNDYIRVNNKLTFNGELSILNNGQFIQDEEVDSNIGIFGDVITPRFKVERIASVNKDDYVYWSSPVDSYSVMNILSGPRYFWNPTFANANGSFGNWNTAASTMNKGKGYIVRVPTTSPIRPAVPALLTTQFAGKPNNGQFDVTISRGVNVGSIDDNWNLIGNPYPSAIFAEELLNLNTSKIAGSVWVWTHGQSPTNATDPFYYDFQSNYYSSDYVKYNKLGASDTTFNGRIASGQGFMINMLESAGTLASPGVFETPLTFNNSMRTVDVTLTPYNNSGFFRSTNTNTIATANEEKHRIWLDILNTTSGQTDRMLLGYSTNSTLAKDHFYDCFFVPRTEVAVYSMIDVNPFIIQGRPLPFSSSDLVPLGIKIVASGNHKIAIKKVDGLFEGTQDIYLEDKLLNIIHDLRQSPYNFTSETGTFNERFVLRYTNTALSNDDFNALDASVIVTTNQNQIKLRSSLEKMTSVVIYDILGREIATKKEVLENEVTFENLKAKKQTLIVKIKLESGQFVTRKIIL